MTQRHRHYSYDERVAHVPADVRAAAIRGLARAFLDAAIQACAEEDELRSLLGSGRRRQHR